MKFVNVISLIIGLFGFTSVLPAQDMLVNPFNYPITKFVQAEKGAVVSAHTLASEAGLAMLKAGGNAFDAVITTQLVLAVVYPVAGNIGGGGFLVANFASGKNIAIDYREVAPAAASKDMYLDAAGNPQLNLSQNGQLAAGVPGTIAGLFASHKFAKLPFNLLIQPAIDLAENGFVISAGQAENFNAMRDKFLAFNSIKPVFVKAMPWQKGDTLVQKDLANTLRRIKDLGAKGFYEGETAKFIVAEMKSGNGIISSADLKNYEVKIRAPLRFKYQGFDILTMPLPSSGGIILQQMLKMIEPRNIAALKFQTAASVQLMTEVERRAFADRAEFLGDPDFVDVPIKKLISKKYLAERMKDYKPGVAGNSTTTKAGQIKEHEQTTHISVIDAEGNAVSVTTTLNGEYGSKTVVAGAGFFLNNEMDDFSVKPGVPNMFGAVGNKQNAIAPNKRMLSSMTPTIVLKNKKTYMVLGTPGGTTIPTSVFQTLVNVLDFKMSITDAVNQPKFHHQWLPDDILIEAGFPQLVKQQLLGMGYKLTDRKAIGRMEVIAVKPKGTETMRLEAVADKRGDDHAAGY